MTQFMCQNKSIRPKTDMSVSYILLPTFFLSNISVRSHISISSIISIWIVFIHEKNVYFIVSIYTIILYFKAIKIARGCVGKSISVIIVMKINSFQNHPILSIQYFSIIILWQMHR